MTVYNSTSQDRQFVDDDYDDDLVVSDDIVKNVEDGQSYYFVLSDKQHVYAYDPVKNTKILKIISDGLD